MLALALFSLFATSALARPNMTLALGGLRFRLHRCPAWSSPAWRSAARTGSGSRCRRARPPGGQRRSGPRPRPGAVSAWATELEFAIRSSSDELRLINLELRAGKPRAEALRNLADRTGVDDVSSLVTMLIQTDKFGTSVAQSLRVYSETLRTKRRQRAEEAAAKTGVKMVFPLVFCIFPAIWVVTIGPAAIRFVTVLFPLMENTRR